MTILVTGGTGHVGRAVVRALLEAGQHVRVVTRDPHRAAQIVDDRAQVVRAELTDRTALDHAMTGVDRVFLGCGNHPAQVEAECTVIDAAAHGRVRRLVKLSGPSPHPDSDLVVERWHAQIEQHLAAAALPAVTLRPCSFMTNLLAFAQPVAEAGALPAPTEGARVAFVDPGDVGAVGAALLLSGSPLPPTPVHVTGPEAVTYAEVASSLADVTGRPVTFVPIDEGTAAAQLHSGGVPEHLVAVFLAVYRAQRLGALEQVSDAVPTYLGRGARSVTEFLAEHRHRFSPAPSARPAEADHAP